MSHRDPYAQREAQRRRAYRDAYSSPEVKAWIASLTPEQRKHAEEVGLLEPKLDSALGHSIEDLPLKLRPATEDATDDAKLLDDEFLEDPRFVTAFKAYMTGAKKPKLRLACLSYLLGNGTCEQYATLLRMSKQAFHYHVKQAQELLGLPKLARQKSDAARASYRKRNRRKYRNIWQHGKGHGNN